MREILIVAGETSGDLHAAAVVEALRRKAPEVPLAGIGGERMRSAGVELLEHVDKLAVIGFLEALRHIPRHAALLRTLRTRLRSGRVGLLVLVDYPGFNLKLADAAHAAGVPVLYYITPQVWAWGAGRMRRMARTITGAAVILPFEEALLRKHGVNAEFVGHPLLDRAHSLPDRAQAREALGLDVDAPVLAIFPGSRPGEIERHLPDFVASARLLEERVPGLQPVISIAPGMRLDPAVCPYPGVSSSSFPLLRAADAAICKSGTTTLEAAVARCPMIIAYRTSALTYAIARRVALVKHIGLVNVVAGREVVPEFVQDALEPRAMADAVAPLLRAGSVERERMLAALDEVCATLGEAGAAERVATMALETMR